MESIVYTVAGKEFELQHHGVKGMKWGVRKKYYGPSTGGIAGDKHKLRGVTTGGLTDRKIEKYAKKGYAQDSLRRNKTVAGKALDVYTGAHKVAGTAKYETSSKKQNQARAEKYVADKKQAKKVSKERAVKIAAKGAEVTSKILLASAADDVFYGGAGKEAIKQTGRAAVTAVVMAHGGYDIKWYDKQGRRVG